MATDVEQGIKSLLSADVDVIHWANSEIHVGQAPQGTALPYLVFRRAGGEHIQHAGGFAGLASATINVQGWAATYAGAKELAKAVRLAMVNTPPKTVGGVKITGIIQESDQDVLVQTVEGEETPEYAVESDYTVWYVEDTS